MQNHIAKHFALQLGSLVSLYLSVGFFLSLVFGLLTLSFPDAADSSWVVEQASNTIRLGFAMVVVFFPTYLTLTYLVNKNRRTDKEASYLGLTKWLIYLSLLVGGAVLLGDLVAIVYAFLEGDITTRFVLKALAVFAVTGLAFYYYILDARGNWLKNKKQSYAYGAFVSVFVLGTLLSSLAYIDSPQQVREAKLDSQQVGDLQNIQWQIEEYYRDNDALPVDIETMYSPLTPPAAPDGREAYVFEVNTDTEYQLCATFANDSSTNGPDSYRMYDYSWNYQAAYWCFEREIDSTLKR